MLVNYTSKYMGIRTQNLKWNGHEYLMAIFGGTTWPQIPLAKSHKSINAVLSTSAAKTKHTYLLCAYKSMYSWTR